ncbi:MAG: acetate kinase [Roseovarius sp.]|nr:acetate kinase [Roseovarius sp.]
MILVVNAGSSSVKVQLFDDALDTVLDGAVSEIGGDARFRLGDDTRQVAAPDHLSALSHLLDAMAAQGVAPDRLDAAAHRIVHGGATLTAPVRLTRDVQSRIAACNDLAPLHNPHNLSGVQALATLAPALPQYGSFDTAFHVTNPAVATTYPIPEPERAKGIRRYGFHGLSYSGLVDALRPDLPRRLLAMHLGNGVSLCGILDGRSVASSMGYSPVDGLVMGTRPGSLDSMAVLRMAEDHGIDGATHMLNHDCGLRALAGTNDMQTILDRPDDAARFAVEHFCYWALRHAGGVIAAMQGLDAIAFTGGIGENAAPIRARIMDGLGWAGLRADSAANAAGARQLHAPDSAVAALIVPANEERVIAADARRLIEAGQ